MKVLTLALLTVALLLQATLVLTTPVGFLQHRHTLRKAPLPRELAPRTHNTVTSPPIANSPALEIGAGSTLLEGRNKDDKDRKNKKGGVQMTGTVVVINNPNGPPEPKEDCDEKSFFKKLWCKVTT